MTYLESTTQLLAALRGESAEDLPDTLLSGVLDAYRSGDQSDEEAAETIIRAARVILEEQYTSRRLNQERKVLQAEYESGMAGVSSTVVAEVAALGLGDDE